jgi:hypothetical protein
LLEAHLEKFIRDQTFSLSEERAKEEETAAPNVTTLGEDRCFLLSTLPMHVPSLSRGGTGWGWGQDVNVF